MSDAMIQTSDPYNPYVLMTPELLRAMLQQPMYFVRQHFPRGKKNAADNAIPLLLTHYIHHEVDTERAQRHMRLLIHDRYRRLYDSTKTDDRKKLEIAACQPEGYRIYVNLLDRPWKATEKWKKKIDTYIRLHLGYWHYTSSGKLEVTLKDRYGDLFLGLSWKHHQTEVHLEDIENVLTCATT